MCCRFFEVVVSWVGMKQSQRKKTQRIKQMAVPATKGDLEDMGAYIVGAIAKTLEEYATKDDVKHLATRDDLKTTEQHLEAKIDAFGGDVSDLRRRVRDLETDTITRREFDNFKVKVLPQ